MDYISRAAIQNQRATEKPLGERSLPRNRFVSRRLVTLLASCQPRVKNSKCSDCPLYQSLPVCSSAGALAAPTTDGQRSVWWLLGMPPKDLYASGSVAIPTRNPLSLLDLPRITPPQPRPSPATSRATGAQTPTLTLVKQLPSWQRSEEADSSQPSTHNAPTTAPFSSSVGDFLSSWI